MFARSEVDGGFARGGAVIFIFLYNILLSATASISITVTLLLGELELSVAVILYCLQFATCGPLCAAAIHLFFGCFTTVRDLFLRSSGVHWIRFSRFQEEMRCGRVPPTRPEQKLMGDFGPNRDRFLLCQSGCSPTTSCGKSQSRMFRRQSSPATRPVPLILQCSRTKHPRKSPLSAC